MYSLAIWYTPPTPWNKRPNSFAENSTKPLTTLGPGWLISCQYFNISPVLPSITAVTVSKVTEGNTLPASRRGLHSSPTKLLAAANATASNIAPRVLERVPKSELLFCWALVLAATGSSVVGVFCGCNCLMLELSCILGAIAAYTLRAGALCTLWVSTSYTLTLLLKDTQSTYYYFGVPRAHPDLNRCITRPRAGPISNPYWDPDWIHIIITPRLALPYWPNNAATTLDTIFGTAIHPLSLSSSISKFKAKWVTTIIIVNNRHNWHLQKKKIICQASFSSISDEG